MCIAAWHPSIGRDLRLSTIARRWFHRPARLTIEPWIYAYFSRSDRKRMVGGKLQKTRKQLDWNEMGKSRKLTCYFHRASRIDGTADRTYAVFFGCCRFNLKQNLFIRRILQAHVWRDRLCEWTCWDKKTFFNEICEGVVRGAVIRLRKFKWQLKINWKIDEIFWRKLAKIQRKHLWAWKILCYHLTILNFFWVLKEKSTILSSTV